MNKYMITITVPSKDKTFSSAILQIGPGGVTVSCPKGSGIEVTQLREGPNPVVEFRLLDTNEEFRFCLENRCMSEGSREIDIEKGLEISRETYLM